MKNKKYFKNDNKYIEWLENNMNSYGLFYFKESVEDPNIIDCYFTADQTHFSVFYKNILDTVISEENNPNVSER